MIHKEKDNIHIQIKGNLQKVKNNREDRSRQMKERRRYHFGAILDGLLGVKSAVFPVIPLSINTAIAGGAVPKQRR